MAIDTISVLPEAPSRTSDPANFNSESEAFVAALAAMVVELNTSIGQMNADFSGTNYEGAWSSATGAKAVGDTFTHNNSLWLLLSAQADITTTEPASDNADYIMIGNAPAGEMLTQSLSGTTPSWNVANGPFAELTLSGNTTVTLSGEPAGDVATPLIFKVTQDASGSGFTLGFAGATIKTEGGNGLPLLSGAANAVDYIALITDDNGTSYAVKLVLKDVKS